MENTALPIMGPPITRRISMPLVLRSARILMFESSLFGVSSLYVLLISISHSSVSYVEPDSLANMVTNLSVAKCANAQSTYEALAVYAWQTLTMSSTCYPRILREEKNLIFSFQTSISTSMPVTQVGLDGLRTL